MPPATFAAAIRRSRIAKNLTQREAAGILGVATMTVSGWERGTKTPKVEDQAVHLRKLRSTKRRQSDAGADIRSRDRLRSALGAALRLARKRADLTQEQVARRSGCSPAQVSGFERGEHAPAPATLQRLRRILAINAA